MPKPSIQPEPDPRDSYQASLVFYLFLASLGMFFVASMVTYWIVLNQAKHPTPDQVAHSVSSMGPESYQSLSLPFSFWISTVVLILVSVFLQRACWQVKRQNLPGYERWLFGAMGAGGLFVIIQCFGMADLLSQHLRFSDGSAKVYGMSFTLALIHALHVLGGMIFLGFIIFQSGRNKYDHQRHWAVDHCAGYWHFLDVVWVGMLITFIIAR